MFFDEGLRHDGKTIVLQRCVAEKAVHGAFHKNKYSNILIHIHMSLVLERAGLKIIMITMRCSVRGRLEAGSPHANVVAAAA